MNPGPASNWPSNLNIVTTRNVMNLCAPGRFSIVWNDRFAKTGFYDGELLRTNYSSHNISVGFRFTF